MVLLKDSVVLTKRNIPEEVAGYSVFLKVLPNLHPNDNKSS
jgi:hypothetical protein